MKAEATIVKPFNILYVLTKAYAELMGFIFRQSKRTSERASEPAQYGELCMCEIHIDTGEFMRTFYSFFL